MRKAKAFFSIFLGVFILVRLYIISTSDYLLFHTLAEAFSIVIAIGIFIVAWNSKKFFENSYLLFLGIAYFFIAGIDLVHTLSYKGMNIFVGFDSNLPAQLWIGARYFQAIVLLIAPIFINRKLKVKIATIVFMLITLGLLASIFLRVFPTAYVEGSGLTQFKIVSEYIISTILIASIFFLYRYKERFDKRVLYFLIGSIILTVFAEVAFIFYVSVYGLSNLIGHMFKIIAFYLIYRALVRANLTGLKIKTILLIGSGISIALTVVFSLMVYVGFNKVAEENKRELSAQEIHQTVAELNILMFEYHHHGEERMLEQWNLRYDATVKIIEAEGGEWQILKSKYSDLKEIFLQLVSSHEKEDNSELEERFVSQFLQVSQVIISDTSLVAKEAYNNAIEAQKTANTSMMIGLGFLFTALMGVSFYTARRITKPLKKLVKGAGIIGEGKLDYKIDIKSRDEIGELAAAFNQMTKDLQLVTASRDELKELDKLKDDFLNNTSHELKTPLIPIKAQLQLLLAGDFGEINEEQRESLGMILRNEERLNKLVSEILDIAKIRSKKLKLVSEEFSLTEIINNAVNEMKPRAQEKKIELIVRLVDLLMVVGDAGKISQVISNLLNNAIKFTPEQGRVMVATEKREGEVVVKITDTGIGIKPENIKKLFTPFFQLESGLARKHGGTGLGLVICRGIIEAHGGKIWVESQGEGKGSTFAFALPMKVS